MNRRSVFVGLSLICAFACWFLPGLVAGLGLYDQRMLGILILAVTLWISEVVPGYATGLLILLLQILFLSDKAPSIWVGPAPPFRYEDVIAQLASPIVVLFLGGFSIAAVATKYKLDQAIAARLLRPFGTRPKNILLGLMLITAGFSMFMSNTATAAMMLAIVAPVVSGLPALDPGRKGFLLAIPIAANIGGMGTPIGSPPNALALKYLSGPQVLSFGDWMLFGVPLVLLLIAVSWWLINVLYRSSGGSIRLSLQAPATGRKATVLFYGTFSLTVALWLTGDWHGMNSYVVALIPLVVFVLTGLLMATDIRSFNWEVLWLLAGGMALGDGLAKTGLSDALMQALTLHQYSAFGAVLLCSAVAFILGNFISHTVSANVMLPLVATLATGFNAQEGSGFLVGAVLQVTLVCSLGMALPVSTPPNALAHATGELGTKDFMITGGIVSLIGAALVVVGSSFFM